MTETAATLALVEAFMQRRRRSRVHRFPTQIEQNFEADTHAERCARLRIGLLVSAFLYNLFLVADWLLAPDIVEMAIWLHFAIVTPWMLFAAWLMSRNPKPFLRECVAASVPLLIVLQIDFCFASTLTPTAVHYQYVVVPLLLYTNVSILRLEFRFAWPVSALIVLIHSALVLSASYITAAITATIIVQVIIVAYITLVANYTMERDLRRSYLYALRDRLRHAEADAASRRDPLTGLANRLHLDFALAKLWSSPNAETFSVAVIVLDIDHFKSLNDRYGHSAGDVCLKRVAVVLQAELSKIDDLAVRYGGEEFLLLLPDTDLIDAIRLAERVRRSIESASIPNEGSSVHGIVTASFGVAASRVSDLAAAELIATADQGLYAAKNSGRNQVWPPFASNIATVPVSRNRIERAGMR